MIIGSDVMKETKIDILCSTGEVQWGEASLSLKPKNIYLDEDVNNIWFEELFESWVIQKAMTKLYGNDYKASDLEQVVAEQTQ